VDNHQQCTQNKGITNQSMKRPLGNDVVWCPLLT